MLKQCLTSAQTTCLSPACIMKYNFRNQFSNKFRKLLNMERLFSRQPLTVIKPIQEYNEQNK